MEEKRADKNQSEPKGKKICIVCRKNVVGRSDKKYCSVECKNASPFRQSKNRPIEVCAPIEKPLWKNRTILHQLFLANESKPIHKSVLASLGYDYRLLTGLSSSHKGGRYIHVYDYCWSQKEDTVRIWKSVIWHELYHGLLQEVSN